MEGPLHRGKSPGYLAEKTNHECGWHRGRDEGFDGPFPAGKRYGVFRGSTAHQKIFLFLHRWEQINFKLCSAGVRTWRNILYRLQVWNLSPDGGQIMRAADCKNLSESPEGVFRQSQQPSTGGLQLDGFESLPYNAEKTNHFCGWSFLAEDEGFEPPRTESESGVLPLH